MDKLTPRKKQIAWLTGSGIPQAEIARRLNISINTLRRHLTVIYQITGCINRHELALLTGKQL